MVYECTNGSELIDALAQNPVDVAITDFSMGHGDTSLDGFNLLRKLSVQTNTDLIHYAYENGCGTGVQLRVRTARYGGNRLTGANWLAST